MGEIRPDAKYLKDKNIVIRLSLKDKLEHRVKLINVKEDALPDGTEGITYLVQEGGEDKTIFTTSISLISQMSNVALDALVSIQMMTRDNKTMFVVKKMIDDDIPVIDGE